MGITYEWVAEEYDEFDDIIDPMYCDTLNDALTCIEPVSNVKYALVRFEGNNEDGITDRLYAYLDDVYELPEYFECSSITIPVRYVRELHYTSNQKVIHN